MPFRGCISLLAILAVSGCAPINPNSTTKSAQLPPVRLAPDAVVLDIAFVSLPVGDTDQYAAIWEAADEQPLPPELRKSLDTNGLRVGILGQRLPSELQKLLDTNPKLAESLTKGDVSELELDGGRQHLPVRAGHRAIVKASAVYPNLPVLISEDGRLRGQQLTEARCIFSLKSYPQGDGRTKLVLTPEIEHGEAKTRWVGSEGMMIQQTGQEKLVLDRLRFEAMLRPGETLLVGPTAESKGLGEYFFSPSTGSNTGGKNVQRRLVVLRYSQSQFDDLFAREQTSAPLTTPGE
jgi:hypothetical protein